MAVETKWITEFLRTRAAERAVWMSLVFVLINFALSDHFLSGLLHGSDITDVIDTLTSSANAEQINSAGSQNTHVLPEALDATSAVSETEGVGQARTYNQIKPNDCNMVSNCTAEIERLSLVMDGLERVYGLESMRNGLLMAGGQRNRTLIFLHKLKAGKQVTILVLGGSISDGSMLDKGKGDRTFPAHLEQRINELFPSHSGGHHKVYVGAMGGGGSGVHYYCADNIIKKKYCTTLPREPGVASATNETASTTPSNEGDCKACVRDVQEADLVLLELAPNDYVALEPKSHPNTTEAEGSVLRYEEALVRRYLSQPSSPLVVFVNFAFCDAHKSRAELLGRLSLPVLNRVAVHYEVPTVSFAHAFAQYIYPVNRTYSCPKNQTCPNNDWIADFIHPTDRGHRAMSDLISYLLLEKIVVIMRSVHMEKQMNAKAAPIPSRTIGVHKYGSHLPRSLLSRQVDTQSVEVSSDLPQMLPSKDTYILRSRGNSSGDRKSLASSPKSNLNPKSIETTVSKKVEQVPTTLVNCPFCIECTLVEAIVGTLPNPLVVQESSKPMCSLATEWKVLKRQKNWEFSSTWVTALPDKARPRLTIRVDFGSHFSFGIVYRRSWALNYKDMGVQVAIGNNVVTTLDGFWKESSFSTWFVNSSIFGDKTRRLGKKTITLRSTGGGVLILALIAN